MGAGKGGSAGLRNMRDMTHHTQLLSHTGRPKTHQETEEACMEK